MRMGDSMVGVAVGAAVGAALGCTAKARVVLLMETATDSGVLVLKAMKAMRLTKVEEDVRDDECRDKRF